MALFARRRTFCRAASRRDLNAPARLKLIAVNDANPESAKLNAVKPHPRQPRTSMNSPWQAKPRIFVGAALLFVLSAQAAVIYRWVDENGRTHVSDVVPEKYKKSAKRIDSGKSEIPPEQRQEAERDAAKEKALADEAAKRRQNAEVAQPANAASQAVVSKRPAQGVTDSTDCETWRRLYQESMECFGPYRTARGATKAEAFEKCNPIPSPDLKCGPLRE